MLAMVGEQGTQSSLDTLARVSMSAGVCVCACVRLPQRRTSYKQIRKVAENKSTKYTCKCTHTYAHTYMHVCVRARREAGAKSELAK